MQKRIKWRDEQHEVARECLDGECKTLQGCISNAWSRMALRASKHPAVVIEKVSEALMATTLPYDHCLHPVCQIRRSAIINARKMLLEDTVDSSQRLDAIHDVLKIADEDILQYEFEWDESGEVCVYSVVVDEKGCRSCHGGRTYTVEGPNGIAIGMSSSDLEMMEFICECMNDAYETGRDSAG